MTDDAALAGLTADHAATSLPDMPDPKDYQAGPAMLDLGDPGPRKSESGEPRSGHPVRGLHAA